MAAVSHLELFMYPSDPIAAVAHWLQEVVIGLNLCPFARKPFLANKVRIIEVSASLADLLAQLQAELTFLDAHTEVDTSILVLTQALDDFLAYNDFIHEVEDWLWQHDYEGIYQVASFHPDYYFADTEPDDVSNFTNRAPYPLLHILREQQLEELLQRYPDSDDIPANNIRKLRALSTAQVRELFSYLIPRGHIKP
jgi:hypothetical protein